MLIVTLTNVPFEFIVPLKKEVVLVSKAESLGGHCKHLFRRLPMNSCRPIRANTLRQNTVKIMTSESFFTDWIRAPTMVFKPVEREWGQLRKSVTSQSLLNSHIHSLSPQTVAGLFRHQCFMGSQMVWEMDEEQILFMSSVLFGGLKRRGKYLGRKFLFLFLFLMCSFMCCYEHVKTSLQLFFTSHFAVFHFTFCVSGGCFSPTIF